MRLCVDAGPIENAHRMRGIGSSTGSLLRALTPEVLTTHGVELQYLKQTPVDDSVPTGGRFAQRRVVTDRIETSYRLPQSIKTCWKNYAECRRMAADVAAAGSEVFLSTDPMAIPRSRRFRTVALLYDLIPLRFPEAYLPARPRSIRLDYAWQLRQLRRADHLIAISEATRNDGIELLGIPPHRISVAPLAVDDRQFHPVEHARARAVVAERTGIDRPYFLYVGGLDPRKNIEGLIRAFASMMHTCDALLVITGETPRPTQALRPLVEGTPVGERVRWTGYVRAEDLPFLYAGSLAFVFPSLYEGFGLPVLEAMSCGAPVLTSPLSSIPEVADGAALYADPYSVRGLADALCRLAAEPVLRDDLRARGIEQARRFSWSRTARQVLEICGTVHEGRARTAPRRGG